MAPWNWPVAAKLPLLMGITFFGSWAVFELVKRTALTRLLFGLKPARANPTPNLGLANG
jgi:hypothetical protein